MVKTRSQSKPRLEQQPALVTKSNHSALLLGGGLVAGLLYLLSQTEDPDTTGTVPASIRPAGTQVIQWPEPKKFGDASNSMSRYSYFIDGKQIAMYLNSDLYANRTEVWFAIYDGKEWSHFKCYVKDSKVVSAELWCNWKAEPVNYAGFQVHKIPELSRYHVTETLKLSKTLSPYRHHLVEFLFQLIKQHDNYKGVSDG